MLQPKKQQPNKNAKTVVPSSVPVKPAGKKVPAKGKKTAVVMPAKPVSKSTKSATKVKSKKKVTTDKPLQKKVFSKKGITKTTKDKLERQKRFLDIFAAQQYPHIQKACLAADITRTTFYEWRDNDLNFQQQLQDLEEARKDQYEANLYKDSLAGDSKCTIFYLERKCRDRGYGKEADSSKMRAILKKTMLGEMTPLDAAYEVNMLGLPLPEVLKIQLGKNEPPAPPDDRPPLTSEELEEKYLASLAIAEGQQEGFLVDRREEVRVLKEEMKQLEQFGPDGEPVGGEV